MKTKDIYIIPEDPSTTLIKRATTCCNGHHQTIAGALLGSPQWEDWYAHASKSNLFDVGDTETIDVMGDKHFQAFIKFCKKI